MHTWWYHPMSRVQSSSSLHHQIGPVIIEIEMKIHLSPLNPASDIKFTFVPSFTNPTVIFSFNFLELSSWDSNRLLNFLLCLYHLLSRTFERQLSTNHWRIFQKAYIITLKTLFYYCLSSFHSLEKHFFLLTIWHRLYYFLDLGLWSWWYLFCLGLVILHFENILLKF